MTRVVLQLTPTKWMAMVSDGSKMWRRVMPTEAAAKGAMDSWPAEFSFTDWSKCYKKAY